MKTGRSKNSNFFRVENGELFFDGHDALTGKETDFSEGSDEDGYFGAMFMSAKASNFVILDETLEVRRGYVSDEVQKSKQLWGNISFGVLCSNPKNLGLICRNRPTAFFDVIPYSFDDLKIIGKIVNSEVASPNLIPLQKKTEYYHQSALSLDLFTENPVKYDDTIWLDIAKCAAAGVSPFNGIYTAPYDDGFSNRFLKKDYDEQCDVCIATSEFIDRHFPTAPTSYKTSGCTVFPTEIETTESFRSATGYSGEKVNLLVGGAHNIELNKFLGFWFVTAKSHYIWTKPCSDESRHTFFTHDGFGFISSQDLAKWRGRFGISKNFL